MADSASEMANDHVPHSKRHLVTARKVAAAVAVTLLFMFVMDHFLPDHMAWAREKATGTLSVLLCDDVEGVKVNGEEFLTIRFDPARRCCAYYFADFPIAGECIGDG